MYVCVYIYVYIGCITTICIVFIFGNAHQQQVCEDNLTTRPAAPKHICSGEIVLVVAGKKKQHITVKTHNQGHDFRKCDMDLYLN